MGLYEMPWDQCRSAPLILIIAARRKGKTAMARYILFRLRQRFDNAVINLVDSIGADEYTPEVCSTSDRKGTSLIVNDPGIFTLNDSFDRPNARCGVVTCRQWYVAGTDKTVVSQCDYILVGGSYTQCTAVHGRISSDDFIRLSTHYAKHRGFLVFDMKSQLSQPLCERVYYCFALTALPTFQWYPKVRRENAHIWMASLCQSSFLPSVLCTLIFRYLSLDYCRDCGKVNEEFTQEMCDSWCLRTYICDNCSPTSELHRWIAMFETDRFGEVLTL